jgi:hypothetical protein
VLGKSALGGRGSIGRAACVVEDDEELITAMVDHMPSDGLDGFAKETAVVAKDLRVAVAEPLEKLGRPFDVGEEESDGAMW